MAKLLEVSNLTTHFFTQDGVVKAVDGITYDLEEGEVLGVVGESGCGKSVHALSIMRLVPSPPGRTVAGEVVFEGENLLNMDDAEMRNIRGNRIAMVFQEPMTSLNPVLTIGRQLTETLELHQGMTKQQARTRAAELLQTVGIPDAERRLVDYPHQFSGGMRQRVMIAMALSCNPTPDHRRRADDGAGRYHPGADTGVDAATGAGLRHGDDHNHAQPGGGGALRGQRERDVRGQDHRDRHRRGDISQSQRHPYTLALCSTRCRD